MMTVEHKACRAKGSCIFIELKIDIAFCSMILRMKNTLPLILLSLFILYLAQILFGILFIFIFWLFVVFRDIAKLLFVFLPSLHETNTTLNGKVL